MSIRARPTGCKAIYDAAIMTPPRLVLFQLKKGGVARAEGVEEKEKECTTECKSQRRLDETRPPGHLISGAGSEEVIRKGRGEEARSVQGPQYLTKVACPGIVLQVFSDDLES